MGEAIRSGVGDSLQPWAGRSLIFVSDIGFRRVRVYPEHWRDLTPNELYALSWKK